MSGYEMPTQDGAGSASGTVYRAAIGKLFYNAVIAKLAAATALDVPSRSSVYAGYDIRRDRGYVQVPSAQANLALSNSIVSGDAIKPTFAGVNSATPAGTTSVLVSWVAASDNVSLPANIWYEIHYSTSPGAPWSSKAIQQGGTSLTVAGLLPGTTYYFRVRARDEAGNFSDASSQAVEVFATTQTDTGPTFAGLATAVQLTKTVARLTWLAASDDYDLASSIVYTIHVSSAAAQPFVESYRTGPGVLTFDIPGLSQNTTYYFKVRAVDTEGHSDSNINELSVTMANTAPTFTGVSGITRTGYDVLRPTWAAASDDYDLAAQIQYSVHISTAALQPFVESYRTPPGATFLDVGGLTIGVPYYFKVRAIDVDGNVDTNVVELSSTLTDNAPVFSGLVGISNPTPADVQLTWLAATDDYTAAPNITYAIHIATAGAQPFAEVFRSPPGATSITIGLTTAGTYYFRVKAVDAKGNMSSDGGIELSASSTGGATPPDVTPPTFAGLTGISNPTTTSIHLVWAAAIDAGTTAPNMVYAIHIGASAGLPFVEYCRTAPGATSITFDFATAGTYYFRAKAVDQAGNYSTDGGVELSASSTGGGGVPDALPPTFAGLVAAATGVATGSVNLSWIAATDDHTPSGSIIYEVHYATSPGAPFQIRWVTAPGATSVTVTGLYAGTTYYFRVRARDAAGNVDANAVEYSATAGLNVGDAPQIVNVLPVPGTTIYPTSTISFDVVDTAVPLRRAIVMVTHGSTANVTEVVHDGVEFKGGYQYESTRTAILNGYHYELKRVGGWFSSPYFAVYAVDSAGLEN